MALLLLDNLYRETITTRVYRGGVDQISGDYPQFEQQFFELAEALSRSPHFKIIDSYSNRWWSNRPWDGPLPDTPLATYTTKRHKGDPIADTEVRSSGYTYPIWYSYGDTGGAYHGDVGAVNSWFVAECQTENPALAAMGFTGLPKWQIKFQWIHTDATGLEDVSDPTGVKYPDYHHSDRVDVHRLAPWGGWDLADVTPDFNPSSPPLPVGAVASSQNSRISLGGGDANYRTQYIITADGMLYIIATTSSGGKGFNYAGAVVGDVVPRTVASMPTPRAMFQSDWGYTGFSYDGFLEEDGSISGNRNWSFWDYNNEYVNKSSYSTNRRSALMWAMQNAQDGYLVHDTHPIIVFPYSRPGMMFEIGHMRKMFCSAQQTIANKSLFIPGPDWSAAFPWDGVTDPYEGY